MKIRLYKYKIVLTALLLCLLACNKDASVAESNVSYKMIANKTWFLEFTQINNGVNSITKTYTGQSTYYVNYFSDSTTLDADGLVGVYSIQKSNNHSILKVVAKTANGNESNYEYNIESLGAKNMILSYTTGTTKTIQYFITQH